MKRIIYRTEGGDLAVVMPASNTKLSLEEIIEKDVRSGRPRDVIDTTQLPADRFFRMAWTYDFDSEIKSRQLVEIDMDKARLIVQDFIRTERMPAFGRLDIEYQRATETEDRERMKEIAELKQVLRDLPASSAIQEAKTPEELEHLARNAVKEAASK